MGNMLGLQTNGNAHGIGSMVPMRMKMIFFLLKRFYAFIRMLITILRTLTEKRKKY